VVDVGWIADSSDLSTTHLVNSAGGNGGDLTHELLISVASVVVDGRVEVAAELQAMFPVSIVVWLCVRPVLGLDGFTVKVLPHTLVALIRSADPHTQALCSREHEGIQGWDIGGNCQVSPHPLAGGAGVVPRGGVGAEPEALIAKLNEGSRTLEGVAWWSSDAGSRGLVVAGQKALAPHGAWGARHLLGPVRCTLDEHVAVGWVGMVLPLGAIRGTT